VAQAMLTTPANPYSQTLSGGWFGFLNGIGEPMPSGLTKILKIESGFRLC
jgi:hypothetical protein